ncbi:MAG: response regulator [Anaerolineae bacterium]|nr:response regulator [Anaerolineae bacterium]
MDRAIVMVVDDDPDFVEITRTVLQAHGYEVASASSGQQALEMMRRERPDLVLLDVMMRGATEGYDVTQVMYGDADLRDIPVLMVTSIMDGAMADQFPTDEYLPVAEFITKPVAPERLVERVRALIGR